MQVNLKYNKNMSIDGYNSDGLITQFDVPNSGGGDNSAASPMQIMLESLGACSFMDIISIIRKKRKSIKDFRIAIEADRADVHPKVFTKVSIKYIVYSDDLKLEELEQAVHLSHEKYCSVSAMFRAAGCDVQSSCEVISE